MRARQTGGLGKAFIHDQPGAEAPRGRQRLAGSESGRDGEA